jgi:hypothetical protein
MTIEQAKQQLVNRYRYLYEIAYLILAPYMHEQTNEEYQKSVDDYIKQFGRSIIDKPSIYLKINRLDSVNSIFEEFLLSDKKLEDTELYKFIESKRNDKEYLEQVKRGIELTDKKNIERCEITKESLDIWKILNATWDYVSEQSGDLKNKESKLRVLDEYYRIARYQNNGKIYKSGRNLTLDESWGGIIIDKKREPFRDKKDIGITNNPFITTISKATHYEDNWSIFTENEKQQIYLDYHDELPCDLEITCGLEEEYIKTMIETRLYRPENTQPCGENFIIKEEEIFVNPNDKLYRYYQLCPHCGYIVNIPKEILSDGIKQRIEERCSRDDKLFRKMFLYSELFGLDKTSVEGQKKMLKK